MHWRLGVESGHGAGSHRLCVVRTLPEAQIAGMQLDTRFEVRLPTATRTALDALAVDTGLTRADLIRTGLRWVLDSRGAFLQAPHDLAEEGRQ
jgi:hypothetical protein